MTEIVLTPALLAKRKQAREVFPNATWLPGDPCPIGARVRRHSGGTATVVGPYNVSEDDALAFWWRIHDDDLDMDVYDWPPSLAPVKP